MLANLTAASASRRQVNGVLAWEGLVAAATARALECGQQPGRVGPVLSFKTHAGWRLAAQLIVSAMNQQAGRADILYRYHAADECMPAYEDGRRRTCQHPHIRQAAAAWYAAASDASSYGSSL